MMRWPVIARCLPAGTMWKAMRADPRHGVGNFGDARRYLPAIIVIENY